PIGSVSRFGQLEGVADDVEVESKYARQIAEEYPHDMGDGQEPIDAVKLYREFLAKEKERVTIVTVGFLGNIAAFVESPPDDISPLTGRELIEQKVTQWVCMGGIFPEGKFPGGEGEYNLRFGPQHARVAI